MSRQQSTVDYDQFQTVVSNREVDERHVVKLMSAIRSKNLLHINPIVCNKDMQLIDGQHRLEAAKRLNLPIHYVVDNEVTKSDIAMINSNAKNWSIMDYINYWTIEKKRGFDKLSAFISANPMIPVSTALHMLSADGSRNTKGLREGIVDTENYEFARTIAENLKRYRNLVDHAYDRNFVLALIHINGIDGFDPEQMFRKVEQQPRSLVKCISKKQYIELFEELYNYQQSKNKLTFK